MNFGNSPTKLLTEDIDLEDEHIREDVASVASIAPTWGLDDEFETCPGANTAAGQGYVLLEGGRAVDVLPM